MNPEISIIVPIYKVEQYLAKCIKSILNQTFCNFELILVDDGSPDNCGEICDQFSRIDNRVKVVHQINQGPSHARNVGIELARGKYIGFVDADDFIDLKMYEILYEMCEKNDADIAVVGYREVTINNEVVSIHRVKKADLEEFVKYSFPFNKLYRRSLFKDSQLRFPIGKFYEDLLLIPKLFLASKRICYSEEILYSYVKRDGATTSKVDDKILDWLDSYVKLKEYLNCLSPVVYNEYMPQLRKINTDFQAQFLFFLYHYPLKNLLTNQILIISQLRKLDGWNPRNYLSFCCKRIGVACIRAGSKVKKYVFRLGCEK